MKKRLSLILITIVGCLALFGMVCISETETFYEAEQNIVNQNLSKSTDVPTENCIHSKTFEKVIASTCHKAGKKEIICEKCKDVLVVQYLYKKEHQYRENIIKEATCSQNGEQNLICEICEFETEVETINKRNHDIKEKTIKLATCTNNGMVQKICSKCNVIISANLIPKTLHNFEVIYETSATPFNTGLTRYGCAYCGEEKEAVHNKVQMNDFYIPSVGINVNLNIGDLNQYNTDNFDVSCSYLYGKRHPIIFGHNYNTLGKIYGVQEGDLIYLKQNGETITYRVTISDIGLDVYSEGGPVNIVSASTGQKCLFYDEESAIHIFTCYYDSRYGNCRWMIVGERI